MSRIKPKIVWVTNKVIPIVENEINGEANLVNEGWISTMFIQFSAEEKVDVAIVCFGSKETRFGEAKGFRWYTVSETWEEEKEYSEKQKDCMISILKTEKPDIIHIWGTEYPHTLAAVNAAEETGLIDNTIVSIQGIISECAKYYCAGLPVRVINSNTLIDFIRRTNIRSQQKMFARRGEFEIQAIKKIKHVIGRTEWDRNCVLNINSGLTYHFCNETLRDAFYNDTWSINNCVRHRIFISQASYPLKGFHIFLEVLPKLLDRYPDIEVHVCGENILSINSIKDMLKTSSYGVYLKKMIKKRNLSKIITFCGKLNAEQMKHEYLMANMYLLCSSLENSSNSVGEAMLLGTPVISSDVGGIATILKAPREGLTYNWDDRDELLSAICNIFDNDELATRLSDAAKEHACRTHDKATNYQAINNIYEDIISLHNQL